MRRASRTDACGVPDDLRYARGPASRSSNPDLRLRGFFPRRIGNSTVLPRPATLFSPRGTVRRVQPADIWTLGVSLYEVLGERTLLETFSGDRDDVIADMVSTCGKLPDRWWNKWWQRKEFFTPDGEWLREIQRIYTPGDRPLGQRLWDMGRGETEETCQWDVQAGEMDALKKLLEGMLMYEPDDRLKAEQLLESEYMVHWAKPAWERQQDRRRGHAQKAKLH